MPLHDAIEQRMSIMLQSTQSFHSKVTAYSMACRSQDWELAETIRVELSDMLDGHLDNIAAVFRVLS